MLKNSKIVSVFLNRLPTLLIEIWLIIMEFLSTRDLVFLSSTCRDLKSIVGDEIAKRQDIANLLSKYVTDVDKFRSVMCATGSSNYWRFYDRVFYRIRFNELDRNFFRQGGIRVSPEILVSENFLIQFVKSYPVKNAVVKSPIIRLPVACITDRNLSTSVTYLDNKLAISCLLAISSPTIDFRSRHVKDKKTKSLVNKNSIMINHMYLDRESRR